MLAASPDRSRQKINDVRSYAALRRSLHSRPTRPLRRTVSPGHGHLTASFATRGPRVQIPSAPPISPCTSWKNPRSGFRSRAGFRPHIPPTAPQATHNRVVRSTSFHARCLLTRSYINQLRDRIEPISRVPQKGGPAPQIDDEPHSHRKSSLGTSHLRRGS